MALLPALAYGAYAPAVLLVANNLSDLASAATARTNLGVPPSTRSISTTAPMTGGGDLSADRTFAVSNCTSTVNGLVPTPPNNTTTFLRGDCTFAAPSAASWTVTRYTSNTTPVTLAHTNFLVESIAQATPAALTINLNATSPAAGDIQCVKDEANTFATNNATVKTTDSSTIDGVAGATGYVMNQTKQFTCFMFNGNANWMIQ